MKRNYDIGQKFKSPNEIRMIVDKKRPEFNSALLNNLLATYEKEYDMLQTLGFSINSLYEETKEVLDDESPNIDMYDQAGYYSEIQNELQNYILIRRETYSKLNLLKNEINLFIGERRVN